MKKIIGALFFLVTGSWFVSCGVADIVSNASAGQFDVDRCRNQRGNAVFIQLANQDQPHISEVNFSYSLNGVDWKPIENDGSGTVSIVDTGGTYRIKAEKRNYYPETALVIVPYDNDCQILEQIVTFTMHPTVLSEWIPNPCFTDAQLIIRVLKPNPAGQLAAFVKFPGGETTRQPCSGNNCILNLTLTNNGTYEIVFSGFPYSKNINPSTSRVSYNYEEIEILLEDGNRRKHIVSEGIEELTLKIPYNLGASGCLEVNHDNISANGTFIFNKDSTLVEIREDATLFVSASNSPHCSMTPVNFDLQFDINLPSGTLPGNYTVEYWFENNWQPAICNPNNGKISCVANIANPFHSDRYHVRAMINNQEYVAAYIALLNKCIYFEK